MTTEKSRPQVKSFVTSQLPWILGAIMLVVFLATPKSWITPSGLQEASDISGWTPGPHALSPVTFLVTYPLRVLPPAIVPFALSLLSAVCAALVLVLLARSVALLPRDRTNEQRQREQNEFSILSIKAAWLPPLLAVLVCGLQLTFWENATEITGEFFDLLIFAYVIRCLLEFRINRRESWLIRFALVYGLGMANSWAMIGFFPAFLAAVIWIKGLSAFRVRFMLLMVIWGLIGLSVIFLMPAVNGLSHSAGVGFWETFRDNLTYDKLILTRFPRDVVLLLALTSLLPIFVIGIRWSPYFGDNSPTGIFVANLTIHFISGLFFIACLWVTLDPPISPRHRGFGISFLTFYYLGALSIGFFAGYFLLVFGPRPARSRPLHNPLARAITFLVIAAVWVLSVAVPALLVAHNLPYLIEKRNVLREYENYFAQIEQSLPPEGAVVLSDDFLHLGYLQSILSRQEKKSPYLLIDTGEMSRNPHYLGFLKKRNPEFQISNAWTNGVGADLGAIQLLEHLQQNHPIYYLQPSFGYFFERFYLEPSGLVYQLKNYPTNTWDVPLPTAEVIAKNQQFWKTTYDQVLPPLFKILETPETPANPTWWDDFLDQIRLKSERSPLIFPLGAFYSHGANYWGVELQRAGQLADAGKSFDQAQRMNPGNLPAFVNKAMNGALIAGKEQGVNPPKVVEERINEHGGWAQLLRVDGPVDEPNFRDELASAFATGGNYRQAVQQYHRIETLSPSSLAVRLQLAQLLIYIGSYTNEAPLGLPYADCYPEAMTKTKQVLSKFPDQPMALFLESVLYMQRKDYKEAIPPMTRLLATETNNYAARLNRAIAYYRMDDIQSAKPDYEIVVKGAPQAYQAYYGLGEIAYREKNTPEAIKNYELYLANAPKGTEEVKFVNARLKELKAGAP
jgi:tetratricopeptide (TPR) repeat protein